VGRLQHHLVFFRRRILAKQLGDFVRVYGKVKCIETDQFAKEIDIFFLLTAQQTAKYTG